MRGLPVRLRWRLSLGLLFVVVTLQAGCDGGDTGSVRPVAGGDPDAVQRVDPESGAIAGAGQQYQEAGPGRWRRLSERPDSSLTEQQLEKIRELQAIGYSGGSRTPLSKGVTVHDSDRVFPGLNSYTSGHAPVALLMDMDGSILHRWQHDFFDIWPDRALRGHPGTEFWRRAFLFENGDILAIHEGLAIIKLDRDSSILWASRLPAHHDLEDLPSGDIYVLSREAGIVPWVNETEPVLEDFISFLSADGKEKRRSSILAAFGNSPFRHMVLDSSFAVFRA